MTLSDLDTAYLETRANEYKEECSLVDKLLAGLVPPTEFELAEPARDYQRIAAQMALMNGGLLIADDVGLGKTLSSIAMLTDPRTRPALVVTLTHLPRQWTAELQRFAPQLSYHIVKTGKPYDLTRVRTDKLFQRSLSSDVPDVILMNYHKLSGWAATLAPVVKTVIFDECQELRTGHKSQKYAAAEHIAHRARFRAGLSATPIYNQGSEIWNVMNAIRPHALGTRDEFIHEWCKSSFSDTPSISNPKAFGSYMRDSGLMLRRTRQDVGRELPDLIKIPHFVDADTSALDRVSASCAELARLILRQGQSERGEKMQAAEELSNKLRQATGIAKAPFVADFVRLLVESGEKVVLYGWHREVYSIWLDRLKDLKPAMYTGSESVPQKDEAKRRFIAGETSVFIISLRAGAGLDGLQKVSRTVVVGELDWSPGVHEQNVGRVYRDGQTDMVTAYFLISESGSDPVVAEVLGLKKQQIDGLRDPSLELVEKLQSSGEHMKTLAESYLVQIGQPLKAEAAA
jgi:SNF2 family DNA or RNA helicase